MKVALDTNVLIAAFITKGVCSELLEHCLRRHEIIMSEFIVSKVLIFVVNPEEEQTINTS